MNRLIVAWKRILHRKLYWCMLGVLLILTGIYALLPAKSQSTEIRVAVYLEDTSAYTTHLQQNLEQMSKHNLILKEISKTDQLTGLYNRWGFLDYVKTIIENPMNQNREVLVLYADMDNLKMINDKYGHDEGDFALREIGMILKEAFRNPHPALHLQLPS